MSRTKLLFIIIISIIVTSLSAQIIPDDNFREAINDELGQPEDYEPTIEDLNGLTGTLHAGWSNIFSIEGAQYLINITELEVQNNLFSDLSPLSGLTNLTSLIMDEIQISDISQLSSLTNLTTLYLYGNQISDLTALSSLLNLESLLLFFNQITDIYPLVENLGLGFGDNLSLDLYDQLLNPLSREALEVHIPILQSRNFATFTFPTEANLNAACYPNPERYAENVEYNSRLYWYGVEGVEYEVYAGTANEELNSIGFGEYLEDDTFFISIDLLPDSEYSWRVKSTIDDEELWSGMWHFTTAHWVATNDETVEIPQETTLHSAYPNPFNPTTTIRFSVKENENAKLKIFNASGQVVKSYPVFTAGSHLTQWNGKDNAGNTVSSGIYFYKLESVSSTQFRKMLMLK